MIEKRKLMTNRDVLIAGRQIEFVTEYSFDECLYRLDYLGEGIMYDNEGITITIKPHYDDVTHFEILNRRRNKTIKGTLQPQNDGTVLVQAYVPSAHEKVAQRVGFYTILIMLIGIAVFGLDTSFMWFVALIIPVAITIEYLHDKTDTLQMQEILYRRLYTRG